MILDASALLAIIFLEPERDDFLDTANSASSLTISVVNFVETAIKIDKDPDPTRLSAFNTLVAELSIDVSPVSLEQGVCARQAHKRFGRGSGHPARLNLGDCFAFALAKTRGEPLLFKGNDFAHPEVLAEIGSAL